MKHTAKYQYYLMTSYNYSIYIFIFQVCGERFDPENETSIDISKLLVHPKSDEQRIRLKEAVRDVFLLNSLDQVRFSINSVKCTANFYSGTVEPCSGCNVRKIGHKRRSYHPAKWGWGWFLRDWQVNVSCYVKNYLQLTFSTNFRGDFDVFICDETKQERLVKKYADKGSFGELALMYNTPRSATVVATSPGSLWVLVGHKCYVGQIKFRFHYKLNKIFISWMQFGQKSFKIRKS